MRSIIVCRQATRCNWMVANYLLYKHFTAQRSKQTDQKTGGGRQAIQMAIRRRQMRPSNRHIASMAAC